MAVREEEEEREKMRAERMYLCIDKKIQKNVWVVVCEVCSLGLEQVSVCYALRHHGNHRPSKAYWGLQNQAAITPISYLIFDFMRGD